MAKKQKIQYINPLNLSILTYDGDRFGELTKRDKLYTVSRVLYENVTLYSFKIPISQSNDDLTSLVEIKMYEDAGLDINKSYKISYIIKELNFDDMCLVEAFAVDIDVLQDTYKECIKKIKYIDFLAFPFFTFTTFYTNKILTPKNDIFIYIGDNESFSSFYKNGSYISTKSMINLEEIVQKINAQNIDMTLEKLSDLLVDKGLEQEMYNKEDAEVYLALETVFSDIFTKVNNIALHNRSVFGFDTIDRIFFSTRRGRIRGLKEFIDKFAFFEVEISDFNLFEDKQESDFLDKIACSYGLDKLKLKSNTQNVTIFNKPPPFLSTEFGKLSSVVLALFVVLVGAYAYFYINLQNLQNQKDALNVKYQALQKRAKIYKKSIKKELKEIKKIKAEIKKQDLIFRSIKESIEKLEKMKGKDSKYISFLAHVNKLLAKYNLKTKSIEQTGKNIMTVEVISRYSQRDKIAKFLKALIRDGFVNVETKEIKLDEDRYISKVEIENE